MKSDMGKYRTRTWLRRHLPWTLAARIPKGKRDCGAHDWYWAGGDAWECYRCRIGVMHESPWSELETIRRRLAGLHALASSLDEAPITSDVLEEQSHLVEEMAELVSRGVSVEQQHQLGAAAR